MGSWSEGCNLSGIEIAEGEYAYTMFISPHKGDLNDGASMYYYPATTLIRGMYNDYGQLLIEDNEDAIYLFNEASGLNLKNGNNFKHNYEDRTFFRWWIREDIFKCLEKIQLDHPYFYLPDNTSVKVKTLGEGRDLWADSMFKLIDAIDLEKDDSMRLFHKYLFLSNFGFREKAINLDKLMEKDRVKARLKGHRDVSIISHALYELRKVFAPSESVGIQHGGEANSIYLAKSIISIQRDRKRKRGW